MAEIKQVYKSFPETYKIISFVLSIGMIYPNKSATKLRLILISLILLSLTPMEIMVYLDMHRCWIQGDIVNLIRQVTIAIPLLLTSFKTLLMFYKRVEAAELIDEFNRDFASYNNFNEEYRTIAKARIWNSKIYTEMGWAITIILSVMIFPVMAVVLNIYSYAIKFESTKYMMHDLHKPFSEPEARFESPYYETIFVYMMYNCFLYIINFVGYDGFYGLCINHACMKIELIWKSIEDAMKAEDPHRKIVEVIKEQYRLFRFVELIQDSFNLWLGVIYIATMVQICTCMCHIVEGGGWDFKYTIFISGGIVHIYLPCHYAAKLKAMSVETATVIYCSGWENVDDVAVKKMLVFMIARTQIPLELTAFKLITYDMKLFTSIMQTSYSLYTLLRA